MEMLSMNAPRVISILVLTPTLLSCLYMPMSSLGQTAKGVPLKAISGGETDDFDAFYRKVGPRRSRIKEDLKGRRRWAWEGEFSNGGAFVSEGWMISSQSGYVSNGKVVDIGTIESQQDRIKLVSESPRKVFDGNSNTLDLVVVKWSDRVYLIRPCMLIQFCNLVNSGAANKPGGPHGRFYLRVSDFGKEVTGLPKIPTEYEDYLLKKPIVSVIQSFNAPMSDVIVTGQSSPLSGRLVTIPAGKRDGLRLGMEFHSEVAADGAEIHVVLIAERSSMLLISGLRGKEKKMLPVGTRLSTKDPNVSDGVESKGK